MGVEIATMEGFGADEDEGPGTCGFGGQRCGPDGPPLSMIFCDPIYDQICY